jgi:hypothetical protein
MSIQLCERDVRLIGKCAASQWLTTRQVHNLFFRAATLDRARKRLRKLVDASYLRAIRPHPMAEMFHAVGPKGKILLEEKGCEVTLARTLPEHLDHLVGINDIRVEVEAVSLEVLFFFAHWELAKLGWPHAVIPDAVFSLRLGRPATFMVEYDRGTERGAHLGRKLEQYRHIPASFPFDAVIIVAESLDGANNLCRRLDPRNHSFRILVGSLTELKARGLSDGVFSDAASSRKMSLADVTAIGSPGVSCGVS